MVERLLKNTTADIVARDETGGIGKADPKQENDSENAIVGVVERHTEDIFEREKDVAAAAEIVR